MIQSVTLEAALAQYERYLKGALASDTVRTRMAILRVFRREVTRGVKYDILVKQINASHIEKYRNAMAGMKKGKGLAKSSRHQHRSAIRLFLTYCHAHRWLAPNVAVLFEFWPSEGVPERDRFRLDPAGVWRVLDAADSPRDRMLIALCAFTLARGKTVRNITWGDISWEHGSEHLVLTDFKARGLDSHEAAARYRVPMVDELYQELITWRTHVESLLGPVQPDWYVVPCYVGGAQTLNGRNPDGTFRTAPARLVPTKEMRFVWEPIQKALAKCGYPTYQQGGHTFRRSMARIMFDSLRKTKDPETGDRHTPLSAALIVMQMTHHKEMVTFFKYIGFEAERELLNKLYVRASIFNPFGKTEPPSSPAGVTPLDSKRKTG